jgi:hypothetical protein
VLKEGERRSFLSIAMAEQRSPATTIPGDVGGSSGARFDIKAGVAEVQLPHRTSYETHNGLNATPKCLSAS